VSTLSVWIAAVPLLSAVTTSRAVHRVFGETEVGRRRGEGLKRFLKLADRCRRRGGVVDPEHGQFELFQTRGQGALAAPVGKGRQVLAEQLLMGGTLHQDHSRPGSEARDDRRAA